jgi:non-specific protein-tyrosine kinase
VAFLIEYLDDTVKSPDEVTQILGASALGAITRTPPVEKAADRLITAAHPKSHISEAYRVMRTNIQFAGVDKPLRTLVVTSANPTEGKTTTLANLGVVMAQAGKKVILVDSDLRRPMLHKIFEVSNSTGLTNLLLQDALSLDGSVADTKIENLRLIPSGPLPPNPSELLGSHRMKRLVETLRSEADVILFDSPPVLPVADAAILASSADGVVLVVDAGNTRRDMLARAGEMLSKVNANIVGAALNKLKAGRSGRYYYYYHYYYYSSDGEKRRRHKGESNLEPQSVAEDLLDRLSSLLPGKQAATKE